MVIHGMIPLWFFACIVGRDLLIVSGGMYVKRSRNIVMMSNYLGKISILVTSLLLFIVIATDEWTGNSTIQLLMWASLGLMTASLVMYGMKMTQALSKAKA